MKVSMYQVLSALDCMCGDSGEISLPPSMPKSIHSAAYPPSQASALLEFGMFYVDNLGTGDMTPPVPGFESACQFIALWIDWSAMPQEVSFTTCVASRFPNEEIIK